MCLGTGPVTAACPQALPTSLGQQENGVSWGTASSRWRTEEACVHGDRKMEGTKGLKPLMFIRSSHGSGALTGQIGILKQMKVEL